MKTQASILETKSILVVDDHQFIRTILGSLLTSLKVRNVSFATDGGEAILLLRGALGELQVGEAAQLADLGVSKAALSKPFDCILTDFNMAPMNGLTLLKRVRCGEAAVSRDTPVVMLTGHSEAHLIAAAMALDVNAFVLKPVSREALETRLVRVMTSGFKAKPVDAYRGVDIPEAPSAKSAPLGVAQAGDKKHEIEEERKLSDVKFGTMLARDVRGPDGAIIARRGMMLTGELIMTLRDISDLPGMDQTVWVRP